MKRDLSKTAVCGSGGTSGSSGNVSALSAQTAQTAYRQTSCLAVEVSCFKDYNTVDNAVNISLLTWLTSTKYRSTVDQIRQQPDKEQRDKLKSLLPAITPSGIFSKRETKGLIQHSGFIGIDIDHKENRHIGNYSELKQEIIKIQNVAYCGISVSGTGYFALIPIQDPAKHLQHFLALEKAFKNLGIVIDHKCKNVDRLRGYSYDVDPYFNHRAKVFTGTYTEPKPARINYRPSGDNDTANVESCLNQLHRDITGDYGTWFEIGCSLANAFSEAGRQYFHQVSRFYERYTARETDRQYDACLKGYSKITLATFFYHCKNVGIEPERITQLIVEQPKAVSHSGPYFETFLGQQIEMSPKGYPLSWDIPTRTPLERMISRNPNIKTLIDRLDLTIIR